MRSIRLRRPLSREEIERNRIIREQIAAELPELIAEHHAWLAKLDFVQDLIAQLKAARKEKEIDLLDLAELSGLEMSEITSLEAGHHPNPRIATLALYAEVVGKRLVVPLTD